MDSPAKRHCWNIYTCICIYIYTWIGIIPCFTCIASSECFCVKGNDFEFVSTVYWLTYYVLVYRWFLNWVLLTYFLHQSIIARRVQPCVLTGYWILFGVFWHQSITVRRVQPCVLTGYWVFRCFLASVNKRCKRQENSTLCIDWVLSVLVLSCISQ